MPTGTPYTLKCPSCKRGKWGHSAKGKGIERIAIEVKLTKSGHKGHGNGGASFYGLRGIVRCRDCGHVWASTHPDSGRVQWSDLPRPSLQAREAGGSWPWRSLPT